VGVSKKTLNFKAMAEKQKEQTFTVTKEITVDKLYRVGAKIQLSDKKTIEKLTSNKFIK